MPRLFTGLEIPPEIGEQLSLYRGGLPGARWIDPADYHITLRFIGDVDCGVARDIASTLADERPRAPLTITIDALSAFGGERPRSIIARVMPTQDLFSLQREHERMAQRIGLAPEARKYIPHVTLAYLRNVPASSAAAFLSRAGLFRRIEFQTRSFALMSARPGTGGGPYVKEAEYSALGHADRSLKTGPTNASDAACARIQ